MIGVRCVRFYFVPLACRLIRMYAHRALAYPFPMGHVRLSIVASAVALHGAFIVLVIMPCVIVAFISGPIVRGAVNH